MALKRIRKGAMESALQSHLQVAARQEDLSRDFGKDKNGSSMILTSPRASALAPRRSKKHSTAPSGRATRRMVPNYGTASAQQKKKGNES
jgi:hypothetical protein